jgi:hypothetical protein
MLLRESALRCMLCVALQLALSWALCSVFLEQSALWHKVVHGRAA